MLSTHSPVTKWISTWSSFCLAYTFGPIPRTFYRPHSFFNIQHPLSTLIPRTLRHGRRPGYLLESECSLPSRWRHPSTGIGLVGLAQRKLRQSRNTRLGIINRSAHRTRNHISGLRCADMGTACSSQEPRTGRCADEHRYALCFRSHYICCAGYVMR
jgi:hypothetical protein